MPPRRLRVFVSSAQKEFQQVRAELKAFLLGEATLRRFVSDVFLFEDLPASDRRADDVYLEEVARCDIYLAILGNEYGSKDARGVSPTEREYDAATRCRKTRLVYVWGADDSKREPEVRSLIRKASAELIRRRIPDLPALKAEVNASLVDHLDRIGALRTPPFDSAPCDRATLADVSRQRVAWFLAAAARERAFPLKPTTPTAALLSHLNLVDHKRPTNAAILLFGAKPQTFHRIAETQCVHCSGTEYRRPFDSMQVYGGDLYEQANLAREFVLSRIGRHVGVRTKGSTAPARYELPSDVVAEAIINAIAHRDYHSSGRVEVRLFADRLEVWNPGALPAGLTPDDLRADHASIPNNPMIAESLYLARYIERAGSGTQAMIEGSRKAGLPEPDFEQRGGAFVATLWRDWLTPGTLAGLSLSARQTRAIAYVKQQGSITNAVYQAELSTSKRTASRDLDEMVSKGALVKIGTTGKGVQYRLAKGAAKGPKGP